MKARLAILLITLSATGFVYAQGSAFTYQGRLSSGGNAANGLYDFQFAIYDASSNAVGSVVVSNAMPVSNGLFTVTIDPGAGVFSGTARWLEVAVRTNGGGAFTVLLPRQPITPTPYASFALNSSATLNNFITGPFATVGGGQMNAAAGSWTTVGGGNANASGNDYSTVGGGQQNISGGKWATIGGGHQNHSPSHDSATIAGGANNETVGPAAAIGGGEHNTSGDHAFVGGGYGNIAGAPFSVIGGGGGLGFGEANTASAPYATVAGGTGNSASGPAATVGGGNHNQASGLNSFSGGGAFNQSSGEFATVSGGGTNVASGADTTVGGGAFNIAEMRYSTVGGGFQNSATNETGFVNLYATVSGGAGNTSSGYGATIGGGQNNESRSSYSTVGGGVQNVANHQYTTVAGGILNQATFSRATVGGGEQNIASGYYATVPGGYLNTASGQYSLAFGQRAKATNDGSFVWADAQGADFYSSANNEFSIRANGGVRLNADTKIFFGNQVRQMLNLWGTQYGIGVQSYTLYSRTDAGGGFAWYSGGTHNDNSQNPGGGQTLMSLDYTGALAVKSDVRWGASKLWPDQGGAIELGNSTAAGVTPYIDFHYGFGSAQDFNVRIANDGTEQLTIGRSGSATPMARFSPAGLVVNGTFVSTSDRKAKENFKPIDSRDVLDKVAVLPLTRWNYKGDKSSEHIGPMAQDFYAAFGVGPDDKHIATVDADGVALAAIQGLNQKLTEELNRRDAENAELKQQLGELKRLVGLLADKLNGGGQ
jgi:hypothetical protein